VEVGGGELYPSKIYFGKEKVKFWMLYQALTTNALALVKKW
jgi:hypothetical protein